MAVESKRVVAILLAAGRSERFGGDKLAAPFCGLPLAHHAALALSTINFARRIVVMGATSVDVALFGFDVVRPAPGLPMSASIVAGVRAAADMDCDACLIALADMPLVGADHFRALMAAHRGATTATAVDARRMVPALFDRSLFAALCTLTGDRGASSLLAAATAVEIDPTSVFDVDLASDIAARG